MDDINQTETIKKILIEALERAKVANLNPAELKDSTNLRTDVGLDSLGLIETIWAIEEKLDIKIDETKLTETTTVGDFIKVVTDLVNQKKGESASV